MACAKRRVPYFLFGEWQILGIGVLVLANVYIVVYNKTYRYLGTGKVAFLLSPWLKKSKIIAGMEGK